MIDVGVNLTGDFTSALDALETKVKGQVLVSGTAAMAKVIYERAKANAPISERTHFFIGRNKTKYGPYTPGSLQRAIYRTYVKERSSDNRAVYVVRWRTQKPPAGVPYGFMVEYGTSRIPPNPFLRKALSEMGEAIKAGQARMSEVLKDGS